MNKIAKGASIAALSVLSFIAGRKSNYNSDAKLDEAKMIKYFEKTQEITELNNEFISDVNKELDEINKMYDLIDSVDKIVIDQSEEDFHNSVRSSYKFSELESIFDDYNVNNHENRGNKK